MPAKQISSVMASRTTWDVPAPSSRRTAMRRRRRPAISREARPPRLASGRTISTATSRAMSR
ncbi:hypothetical protein LUX39_18145 [Actinomadura madurae]|nr:hypothetical protein [Actinomadura madurae]MCQ0015423.1 hypothetical protein [Actinomadura madurae]